MQGSHYGRQPTLTPTLNKSSMARLLGWPGSPKRVEACQSCLRYQKGALFAHVLKYGRMDVCVHVCMYLCIHISTYLLVYVPMYACMHAFIHNDIHKDIKTYIQTYRHTYIHTTNASMSLCLYIICL